MNKTITFIQQKFVQLNRIGQTFLIICLLRFICPENSFAQAIIFDDFPRPAQIYQRDDQNQALVTIKGRLYTEGFTDVSVIGKKDKKDFYRKKQKLTFQAGELINAPFLFQPVITSGLIEYEFYFYAHRGSQDSVLVKEITEVLCGDNIIIYGQSNAEANDGTELAKFTDEFRFGRTTFANFETNEYLWFPSQKWNHYMSGLIGLEIQRQLIDKYKIPIGIINGAIGNQSIDNLMTRNENNHEDSYYYYGQLLKKANKVGLSKTARILIWRQGESEAFESYRAELYPEKFDKFRKQILEDFPAVKKIYVFQNNIYWADNDKAGDLRDFQRRVKQIYPDCEPISTVGTIGFDGLHYSYQGYLQNGQEVSRLIEKDFMKSTDTLEIRSPNIQKAYFSDNRDSLILEFDKNQKMVYPQYSMPKNNNGLAYLKDYIFLDGVGGKILGGTNQGNRILLKLSEKSTAKRVTYTPDNFSMDGELIDGIPYLKNSKGVRALTFKNFPITAHVSLPKPVITARWNESPSRRITLEWPASGINTDYTIEKSVDTPNDFVKIITLKQGPYNDLKVKKGVKYYYRLNIDDEVYSDIIEVIIPLETMTGIVNENEELKIYPNPVSRGTEITLNLQFPVQELQLSDNQGIIVRKIPVDKDQVSVSTAKLNPGIYMIEAIGTDRRKIIRKVIVD